MLALIVTKVVDMKSTLFSLGVGSLAVVTALDPERGLAIGAGGRQVPQLKQ
jgi:hypothetical protein